MRPEPGDIVIARLDDSPVAYALGVVPSPSQILCGSYDEALAYAKQFAAKEGVDVWVVEDEHRFALVARRRAAARHLSPR